MNHANLLKSKLQRGGEHPETVLHATPKVDGRGFFEILGGTGNFSDAKAEVNALRQHLIIEDEVVGIFEQRKIGENFAAEGAVSGVVLGKLYAEK